MGNQIHPSAVVSPNARLGSNNHLGPFVVIEDDVVMGDDNRLMTGAVVKDGVRIGNGNTLHEYAVVGGTAQDLSFEQGKSSYVQLGNGNVLREYVTVQRSNKEGLTTMVGDDNYFMANAHVAHDCVLGNNIVIAPSTGLGGHVHVQDRAFVSGGVMVHQFVQIGAYAMLGGNTKLTQDALPYMITDGHPGSVKGLNLVGLKRGGFSRDQIAKLKKAYHIIFSAHRPMEAVKAELADLKEPLVDGVLAFMESSRRGFPR